MSDELIKSLQGRITQLETENRQLISRRQKAKQEADGLRKERDDAKAQLDDLVSQADAELGQTAETIAALEAERDGFRTRLEQGPDEKQARITELETMLRTRDFRDEFTKHVGKDLADGWGVDDLWHYGGFDPAKVEAIDPQQITELVGKVKEVKPGMFVKPDAAGTAAETGPGPGQAKPAPKPLTLGDSGGRGTRDGSSGRVTYRKSDLHAADWMMKNKPLVEALSNGTAECLD